MPPHSDTPPDGPAYQSDAGGEPVADAVAVVVEQDGGEAASGNSGLMLGFVAMLAAALAMSISPILVRFADVGPFSSAFWRVCLALPILWLWMRNEERGAGKLRAARFPLATVLAGLAFAGDLLFWHLAIVKTTVANATFFATMAPVWVVVFGWLILKRRPRPAVLAGLAICLLGGTALVERSLSIDPALLLGDAFGVITGVFFGLYFLSVGAAREKSGAARVTFELTLITTVILFVVAIAVEGSPLPGSAYGWGVLLVLAIVSHAGGQGLLSVALGRLSAAFSSLVLFIEAIAAAGFAWLLLDEPVSPLQAVGGLVIIFGIWVARPRGGDGAAR